MVLNEAIDFIDNYFPRYSLIQSNGVIITGTLRKESIIKIFPTVSSILNNLPIKSMYVNNPVVIFRVSETILLILLTNSEESLINKTLDMFFTKYAKRLEEKFKNPVKSLKDTIKFTVFSIARRSGPEPFGWVILNSDNAANLKSRGLEHYDPMDIPTHATFNEDVILKYSISSMMLLMNERRGANKDILNFHPFIGDNILGIIYLFQIPLEEARGGAFDSAILVSTEYKYRAILYEKVMQLEKIFAITKRELINIFESLFEEDVEGPLRTSDRPYFNEILEKLIERLGSVSIKLDKMDIKEDMLKSIKSLEESLS